MSYTARNVQEMDLVAGQTYTVTGLDPTGEWYKTINPATSSVAWIPKSYCDEYLLPFVQPNILKIALSDAKSVFC